MAQWKYFRFVILCLVVLHANAQPKADSIVYSLSGKFQYSSIWTEKGSLQQFTKDHPWSAQLDLGITKITKRAWNYCHCYSQNGLSFSYINLANPSKLGTAITVSSFAEPYLFFSDRFRISLRGSAGFAFLNKIYDSLNNRENIFFSTKMSFLLSLGVNFNWRMSNHWSVNAFGQFNHISNGGRRDPNEGMNFPGLNIGLAYDFNPLQLTKRNRERFTDRPWGLMAHVFGNQRTAWPVATWPEEKRIVVGLNAAVIKRLSNLSGVGPGVELYYDGINSVIQQRSGQSLQTTVGAVNIQHYLFFGKLLLGQQLAWYVTPDTGFQKKLFQRYTIEYEVKRNWYAGFSLKAHGDHSDYFAFSTGYYFVI